MSEKKTTTHSEQAEKARKVVAAKRKAEQSKARDAARREATGEDKRQLTITHKDITVVLDEDLLDDYDLIESLNEGDVFPLLRAWWPDKAERDAALLPLRDEEGKLSMVAILEWVAGVFEQVKQGNF